ncbi:MAG: bifunctional phosphoribosylaminoimidazolecarboxamide formyltransferase/IMP cyclohydrolase [Bacteroidales bacterium]|nr:bifunctional phosphoribosylaminoimidazolecarboxamide formyltransferase/IMP cyclohydrolase [Bacteroidales bacterium]
MSKVVKIQTALVSVFHKDQLDVIINKLSNLGIQVISTGGTKSYIEELGHPVDSVENLTGYPSILGGRVKTLHPKIFGGILARRDISSDNTDLEKYEIPSIDLIIVDLYPFEETVLSGADHQSIIEKIDIGGISLIRAAAKNYKDVLIVSSQEQYGELIQLLDEKNGEVSLEDRKKFAAEAFNISSHYDTAIFNYFNQDEEIPAFKLSERNGKTLRYGENPHQKGVFFGDFDSIFEKLHGKEISYNNLLDIDAAVNLIEEFKNTTFAILKHNNACGLASRTVLIDAWKDALAGDPISAFGGILITNQKVDEETAEEINKLFFEAIIAPAYSDKALEVLKQKKNRIILILKETKFPKIIHRSVLNGTLVQDKDTKTDVQADMTSVTDKVPSAEEYTDLEFANKIVKHTKSNTIVLAKNNQLLASGVGQTSRVDALLQAIEKARHFEFNLEGAVMASDAFFPFADSVEIAGKAGISSVIQPGGSIRDKDSIDYCNKHNISMVFTGTRHFKH